MSLGSGINGPVKRGRIFSHLKHLKTKIVLQETHLTTKDHHRLKASWVGQTHDAYVDDFLLFISDPISTVPLTIKLLNRFGTFLGYKLNFSKGECFAVNNLALQIPDKYFLFKMSRSSFKHLGMNICRQLSDLYKKNFPPVIDKLNWTCKGGIVCI